MKQIEQFLDFMNQSTCAYYAVENSRKILEKEGFEQLEFDKEWKLVPGGKYFVKPFDTSLYAFHIGEEVKDDMKVRFAVAHTDSPAFHIKPSPELKEKGYIKLNTEGYGGMILSTWYDRKLSVSGKVSLRSENTLEPKEVLVDFKEPVLVIPNLAIHLNREVNKGVEINKQTDTLPLFCIARKDEENHFLKALANQMGVEAEDILNFDLYAYNLDKCELLGVNKEFICGPRLDDLTSVYALLQGIMSDVCKKDLHIIGLYDNEEIGNQSKQGAATQFTSVLLEKIFLSLGKSRINLYEALTKSILMSADVAHAYHPNYGGKYDITNTAQVNQGIVIKIDGSQRYAYDTHAIAMLQQICEKNDIPYQKFANRSDVLGGSTMGPVVSTLLPMRTVEIGIPLLAMHSAVETMGVEDQDAINRVMIAFFSEGR